MCLSRDCSVGKILLEGLNCNLQGYLSEDALFAVKQLLPDSAEGDLAAVCSWADEVRFNYHYRWSSALHYVDTPDFKCNYEYCSEFVWPYATLALMEFFYV